MILTEVVKLKELMNGTSMDVGSFLHIAIGLTESVHKAHKQNKLIGNLNPMGIQIQLDMKVAILTDHRLARLHLCISRANGQNQSYARRA